jgi:hypothetical protein
LDFSTICYEFYKLAACPHKITKPLGGVLSLYAPGSLEQEIYSHMYPCQPPTAAGRSAPACSHRRRGHRWGGTGLARPTGRGELVGGGCARWAEAEHGWWRGGAAAATACWRSRQGAGEQGNQSTQKHRGEVRKRFPYLIWLRKEWKWVVDGEVVLGCLR